MLTTIIVIVVILLLLSLRVVKEYDRGVIFFLGKCTGVKGPGLIVLIPIFQQMTKVTLRTITMNIPSQKIITKDNVSIDIAAVAYYHIVDPKKSVLAVERVYDAVNQISQTTVRNIVGKFSLDQLLSQTGDINVQIKDVIDRAHRTVGRAGDRGRDQGHHLAGQHAESHGQGSRGRARAPRQDRGCSRRIPGRGQARRSC